MEEHQARKAIVEIGRRLYDRRLVAATEGNLSVRCGSIVVVTPTGVSKGFLSPRELAVVDLTGAHRSGPRPTTELAMHLCCYRERPDVEAVIHAHPPTTVAFSLAGRRLDTMAMPEAVFGIGHVASIGYALPTTDEVPDKLRPHLAHGNVFILDRHGTVTCGATLTQAYHRLEALEHAAEILWRAEQLGAVSELPADEQRRLLARAAELRIDLRGLAAPNPDDNVRPLRSKERRWS
ncbi:MAG: class II aldolase/adducin family protein [Myxococcales bacterium]|nr:class II aldolase/adducin family protein [Myxococcales bacterium]